MIVNLRQKAISSLRKIWKYSILRRRALENACVDNTVIVKKRLYKCAKCGKEFHQSLVEVDHIESCSHDNLENFFNHLMCNVVKYDKISYICYLTDGSFTSIDDIVSKNLQVLCIDCHKEKTKNARASKRSRKN